MIDRTRLRAWAPRLLVVSAAAILGIPACYGPGDLPDHDDAIGDYVGEALTSACTQSAILAGTPSGRRPILQRAFNWVNGGAQYSQTPQSRWGGYRTDCSGLVSMSWGLRPPGHTTHSFAGGPWDDGVSRRIAWSDLEPGDALNLPQHHIMLFAGWLDENRTRFCTVEEYNWGHPASILHHTINDISHGSRIRDIYIPTRFTSNPPGVTSGGSTGGTGGGTGGTSGGGASCYSHTLEREMRDRSCVESRFDHDWYQCVNGVWRATGGPAGAYGACVSTNPLQSNHDSVCYSSTLGRNVQEGTCLQSRLDSLWYQCTDTGWVYGMSLPGSGRGAIGACTSTVPLR